MRRKIILILLSLLFVIVLILVTVAVWQYTGKQGTNSLSGESILKTTENNKLEEPIQDDGKIQAACRYLPGMSAQLSFSTSGLVDSFQVVEGQDVADGDVLARLDGQKQVSAQLASAQRELFAAEQALEDLNKGLYLQVAQALKKLRDAEIAEKDAVKLLNRLKDANKSSAEINQAEADLSLVRAVLQQARETYDVIKNGIQPEDQKAAELRLQEAQANLDALEEAVAGRELRAPFSGRIVQIYLTPGEFAAPGGQVISLVDFNSFYIETTNLNELNVVGILPGDPAEIKFDAFPDKSFLGVVDSIQPFGQKTQGEIIYTVKIKGDFEGQGVLWGMTCTVAIGD